MPLRSLFSVPPVKGGSRVFAAWNPTCTSLCVVGGTGVATLYDRSGTVTSTVQLDARAQCTRLDWDAQGEVSLPTGCPHSQCAAWLPAPLHCNAPAHAPSFPPPPLPRPA